MNPLVIPCSTPPANCAPCFVSPIANLSSELPDHQVYIGVSYESQDPPITPPIINQTWTAYGCVSFCTSTISQTDANECADRDNALCALTNPPGTPPLQLFLNTEQTGESFCPDGSVFSYTVAAGTFYAESQAAADQFAGSWAFTQSRKHRICLGTLPTSACYNAPFTATLTMTGGVDDPSYNFWDVSSGDSSLPAGLTLNGGFSGTSATLSGTPTQDGPFTFTIRVTTLSGDFMEKTFTMCIGKLGTFPNPQTGIAYDELITLTPCFTSSGLAWSVSAGALPPGLSLDPSIGVISGIATMIGTYNFTVAVVSGSLTCNQAYTMQITSGVCNIALDPIHCPALYAYWQANGGPGGWNGNYANEGVGPPNAAWSSPQFGLSATDINFNGVTFLSSIAFNINTGIQGPNVTYTKAASVSQTNCFLGTYTLATWNGIGTTPPATVVVTT